MISHKRFERLFVFFLLGVISAGWSGVCIAQSAAIESSLPADEMEQYERFAQTIRSGVFEPFTIRSFTDRQQEHLSTMPPKHPWSERLARPVSTERLGIRLLPIGAELIANSAFPYGDNDGPVWAGKGFTAILRGGFAGHWKNASFTFAPVFFRAQNSAFPLMYNGESGKLRFADGQHPDIVDRPQRFGESAYQVLDPGESSIAIEGAGLSAGVSTATQSWGPAERYQFLLGRNAPGFAHVFLGSREPVNVGFARVHARFIWGILEQSAFSPVGGPQYFEDATNTGRRRFASGLVATLLPHSIPGMEIGVGRFFHTAWPQEGLSASDFTSLFQNIFKKNLPREAPLPGNDNTQGVRDNQLFSVFTRWAPPGTGFEVYGEFGRDDHSYDLRDFLQEPDHGGASRMLGLRKMWSSGYALRAETINYEAPQLTKFRPEGAVYLHYVLRQGHTQRGQPLGADVGMGAGSGGFVSVDKYTAAGRTTIGWSRAIAHRYGLYYVGGPELPNVPDVLQTLSAEGFRFKGPVDVTAKLNLTLNFNRNFQSDVFNLNFSVGSSYRF